ncbi:hypothetical protein B5P21_01060 [Clavibacter michiganensis subsp. insidiosus]|nr:hypothetical protein B5P21_01060 [Clavibacter michiganensis subsp. insidiosus]
MSFITRSIHPIRHARRACFLAAAVALSAAVGLGVAPASASEATTTPAAVRNENGSLESSLASGRNVQIQFQTHWTPGGRNVDFISVRSTKGSSSHCYSMGASRPGVDMWPFIKVDLPEGTYDVISYNGSTCDPAYQLAGGHGLINTSGHNWMVHNGSAPTRRA